MNVQHLFAVVLFAAFLIVRVKSNFYCTLPPCGQYHIGCISSGDFNVSCRHPSIVNLLPHIETILVMHNTARDLLAGGSVGRLKGAARMARMQWNDELAELALLNSKRCVVELANCTGTESFPYVGQNVGLFSYTGDVERMSDEAIIADRINDWLKEVDQITKKRTRRYPRKWKGPHIGHYTLMVTDHNTHVGCGAVRFSDKDFNHFTLTCNYSTNNIYGRPVYKSSKNPGSKCKTGKDYEYLNLCSLEEEYPKQLS